MNVATVSQTAQPRVSHMELIAAHRARFLVHAFSSLDPDCKEIQIKDDCGTFCQPVDRPFVNAIEAKLTSPVDRRKLCYTLARGEVVPELECALSAYVVRLTGRAAA
jgi:hypothetical protein